MKPLLFIVVVTGLGILISLQFGNEVTWFNYYVGAAAGLLIGSTALEYWSKRKRATEEEKTKPARKRNF